MEGHARYSVPWENKIFPVCQSTGIGEEKLEITLLKNSNVEKCDELPSQSLNVVHISDKKRLGIKKKCIFIGSQSQNDYLNQCLLTMKLVIF